MDNHPFPSELVALPQWVCWRLERNPKGGNDRKMPYDPATSRCASVTDSATWCTFEVARAACEKYMYSGLGFVFTAKSGIVGIDIDHCRDPATGALNETAVAVLQRFTGTYAEISPSGTGVHLFAHGEMPGKGNKNTASGVEMYGNARYFTMTGKPLDGAPAVISRDEVALRWVYETYIKPPAPPKQAAKNKTQAKAPAPLTDEDVLDKARSAKNGDAFTALWDGNWQEKYPSQSEADFALCCSLAFWTRKDKEQMDRLFRQSALFRPKWDVAHHAGGATYGEETIDRAIERTEDVYSPEIGPRIFEHEGRYFRAKAENISSISNFVCVPQEMVMSDEDVQMTADMVTTRGETFRLTFMTTDFTSLPKFKNVLNKRTISLNFTGNEADVELLKGYLASLQWTTKRGVRALGIHPYNDAWVFVSRDGAIDSVGKKVEDIIQLEKFQSIETTIHQCKPIDAAGLVKLGAPLLKYNEPAKTVAILAWCAGCFIKEHLRRAGIKYPHLALIGEAGSGKSTTLENIVLAIFSCLKVVASTQTTGFTLMMESSSSNLIPQALDEFKPSKTKTNTLHALYNHMRDSYDGHDGKRGRSDQSITSYPLRAPLIVAGEESPDEAAIRERSIELLFATRDIKGEGCAEAFEQLRAMRDELGQFGRALLNTALATPGAEVLKWYNDALGLFDKAIPSRIANNLACCMAGLRLIEKLCGSLGLKWDDVISLGPGLCAAQLKYVAKQYILDGGDATKSVVEKSLEIMARMGLEEDEVCFKQNGAHIAMRFSEFYDRFTKYRKEHAIIGECLGYDEFMRQIAVSEFFLKEGPVRFPNGVQRATTLDYSKMKEKCRISTFNRHSAEPLGPEPL